MASTTFGRPRSYERELPSRGLRGLGGKVLGEIRKELVKCDPTPGGFCGEGVEMRRRLDVVPSTVELSAFAGFRFHPR